MNHVTTQPDTFGHMLLGGGLDPWWLVLAAVLSALIGMMTHWAKKVYKDGDTFGFVEYFFVKNLRASVITTLTMLGGLFAAFAPLTIDSVTLYQVILQSWTIGYSADSAFNNAEETK